MTKELGKLSIDQFEQVAQTVGEFQATLDEFRSLLTDVAPEKFAKVLDEDYAWANLYALDLPSLLALLIGLIGRASEAAEIAKSDDPQGQALAWVQSWGDDWTPPIGVNNPQKVFIAIWYALMRNVAAMMTHGRSMHDLARDAAEGNDDALFALVALDRSALSATFLADRLAKAQLVNDEPFFARLGRALAGPSKKKWEQYNDIRYLLLVLLEAEVAKLSDELLVELFVKRLKLYADVPGAAKNLRKQLAMIRKAVSLQPPQNKI